MNKTIRIFYSWQSDIKKANYLITNCLNEVVEKLNTELKSEKINIIVDQDTRGKSGSPSIPKTILEKIDSCNLFIADITLINNNSNNLKSSNRLTPNPNVLIELGYALHGIGWDRIILLNNLDVSSADSMPFDIRGQRISGFKLNDKKRLIGLLDIAIKSIINNYDDILEKYNKDNIKSKDIKTFKVIEEIYSEQMLKDRLNTIGGSLHLTDYDYHVWDKLKSFYSQTLNEFRNISVHKKYSAFLSLLDEFQWLCVKHFEVKNKRGQSLFEAKNNNEQITDELEWDLLNNIYHFPQKNPYPSEEWIDAEKRVVNIQKELNVEIDKLFEVYKEFVIEYKNLVLI